MYSYYYDNVLWGIFGLIASTLSHLFIPIIIAIIVILIVKSSSKKNQIDSSNLSGSSKQYPYQHVVQSKNQQELLLDSQDQSYYSVTSKSSRKPNPNMGLNILLLVGSFLIIASVAIFTFSSESDLIKPIIVMIITMFLYILGLFLFKTQKHLIPAAKALVGTALAIVPFWIPLLDEYTTIPDASSWLIVSIFGTIIYITAAVMLESQIVAFCSFAFFLSFAFSAVNSLTLPMIWFFITPIIVSCATSVIYLTLRKKIPKYYRNCFLTTGKYLTPIVLISSLLTIPESSPYMFTIISLLATGQYLLTYLLDKSYSNELFLRFIAHATIITATLEILVRGDIEIASNIKPIIFGVVWLITFTFQTFLSVADLSAASRKNSDAQLVLSILGVLPIVGSILLFLSLSGSQKLIIFSFILGVIATLSYLSRRLNKGLAWTYLMNLCLLSIPLTIISGLEIESDVSNVLIFVIYLVLASFTSMAVPYCIKIFKGNHQEIISQACLINTFSSVFMIISTSNLDERVHWLGWLMAAACLAGLFYTIRKPKLYEISIYVAAVSAMLLLRLILEHFIDDSALVSIVVWHIPAIAVLCASMVYESKKPISNRLRFILSFITLFLISAMVGLIAITTNDPIYASVFLIEQIIFLIIGYLIHVKWVMVTAAIGTILALIYYLKDLQYLLLAILGLALIIFVIWRLSKTNKEENQEHKQ